MTTVDLTERFVNRPVLISEETALGIAANTKVLVVEDLRQQADQMWLEVASGKYKPYEMQGSVAILPVNGRLYNKMQWAGFSYTGYQYITNMLDAAEADPDVEGVFLDIDSGGGEVDGAFETADRINAFSKPTYAYATHAYSAAYLLASGADKIGVARTGGVGSIGVVTMHADLSKMYESAGINITLLYKGKHKVDGNPYEPLPAKVRQRIEARLESSYSMFVDAVATNRSMDAQAVRDTEALTYGADDALEAGLVDSVVSRDAALAAFKAELTGSNGRSFMTNANATNAASATPATQANAAAFDQQALDAARSEGAKAGAEAERERILGILGCDEAEGRKELASVLCKQGLTVDSAKAIMAAAPKAQVTAPAFTRDKASHFETAMANTPNPEVRAEGEQTETSAEPQAWQKAVRALNTASGSHYKLD